MRLLTNLILSILLIGGLTACKKEDPLDLKTTPNDFLSDDRYSRLNVEILSVEGYEPNVAALENLQEFLEARLNKPKGITFIRRSIPSPQNYTYTTEDIRKLEKEERSQFRKKENLAAFIFYTDSEFAGNEGNTKTLGIAYGESSMAVFKPTVDASSGGLGQVSEEKLESAVLMHEFSHVLGLVNNGTEMVQDHEDASGTHHCDNENCLMYYASETSDMLGILLEGDIPELDTQCIADLQANGGK